MTWRPAKSWTSQGAVGGYRHFMVIMQGGRGVDRWVELVPVLAPGQRHRVKWCDLNDPSQWMRGWQQIPDLNADPPCE